MLGNANYTIVTHIEKLKIHGNKANAANTKHVTNTISTTSTNVTTHTPNTIGARNADVMNSASSTGQHLYYRTSRRKQEHQ